MKDSICKALRKDEKIRLCKEIPKKYGKLLESFDNLLKLPSIGEVLGNYHYNG